jgi:hypothetical protein
MKKAKATVDMANHFVYYFGLFVLLILASTLVITKMNAVA